MKKKMPKTEQEWRKKLSPETFHVLREKGTELSFTGKLLYNKDSGVYKCSGCGNDVFSSDSKFESGTGWPSFFKPISKDSIETQDDFSHGTHSVQVICKKCRSHLGHVFDDGPKETGLRYCINSCSLDFGKVKKVKKKKL